MTLVELSEWGERSGEKCVRIRSQGEDPVPHGIRQTINVDGGARYRVACWAKASDKTRVKLILRVEWLDSDDNLLKTDEKSHNFSEEYVYEEIKLEAASPKEASKARVTVAGTFTDEAELYVDDIYMSKIHVFEGDLWTDDSVAGHDVKAEANVLRSEKIEDSWDEFNHIIYIGSGGKVLADVSVEGGDKPKIFYDPALNDPVEARRRALTLLKQREEFGREIKVETWADLGVEVGDLAHLSLPSIGVSGYLYIVEAHYSFHSQGRMTVKLGGRRRLLEDILTGMRSELSGLSLAFRQGEAFEETVKEPRTIYFKNTPPIDVENAEGVVLDEKGYVVLAEAVTKGTFETSILPSEKYFKRWIKCGYRGDEREGEISAELLRADGTVEATLNGKEYVFLDKYIPKVKGSWIRARERWKAENGILEAIRGVYNLEAVKLVREDLSTAASLIYNSSKNLALNISKMRTMRFAILTDSGGKVRIRLRTDEANYLETITESNAWSWMWHEIGIGAFTPKGNPDPLNINWIEFSIEDEETRVLALDFDYLFQTFGRELLRLRFTLNRESSNKESPVIKQIYWVWEVAN